MVASGGSVHTVLPWVVLAQGNCASCALHWHHGGEFVSHSPQFCTALAVADYSFALQFVGDFFGRLLVCSSFPHIFWVLVAIGRKMRIYILGLTLAL